MGPWGPRIQAAHSYSWCKPPSTGRLDDLARLRNGLRWSPIRRVECERPVRAHLVVVLDVLVERMEQMLLVEHDDVVETLPPQRPDDALRDSIRIRCVHRRHSGRDPDVRCALDEVLAVAAVMVADEVARRCSPGRVNLWERSGGAAPEPERPTRGQGVGRADTIGHAPGVSAADRAPDRRTPRPHPRSASR